MLSVDLVENDEAAAVVAEAPIYTALAQTHLFLCVSLSSPTAQDTDTPGHRSHNGSNQHFNDLMWWNGAFVAFWNEWKQKFEKSSQNGAMYFATCSAYNYDFLILLLLRCGHPTPGVFA